MKTLLISLFTVFLSFNTVQAQNTNYRPGLFFREDFAEQPDHSERPLAQKHIANPNLILKLYGAGKDSLSKSHHAKPVDDPHYVWSGRAEGNWMIAFRHKSNNVDLSGNSKIKWRTKQSGFRVLRICLKQKDGTWLISSGGDGRSADWRIREFNMADLEWYGLDPEGLYETKRIPHPDLSDIEEIGFTDLMRGGFSKACSRVDWIEVYGKAISR